jgi:phytoene dehydrogenase-like protein
MKKAIVIGSGMGGACIASLLAASGEYAVTVLEKNGITGGRFHTYARDGFNIDVGCHGIANSDKGRIGEVLRRIGQFENVKWHYTQKPGPIYIYKGQKLKFPSQMDRLGIPPEEIGQIVKLYQDVMAMGEADFAALDDIDMGTFLRRYSSNERLLTVFGFIAAIYFCVDLTVTPAGEWARCQQEILMSRASGYPEGGTGAITNAMLRAVAEKGGEVRPLAPVEKVAVEDGAATGVILKGGEKIAADLVISNAGIKCNVLELIGPEVYPETFVDRVTGYTYTDTNFTVKIALDAPITDEKFIFYIGREDIDGSIAEARSGEIPKEIGFMMIPVISNMDATAAPPGRQLLLAGTGCWHDPDSPREHWEKWRDACLTTLEKIFPDLRQHILWVEYSHPGTIKNLFGEEGNIIGVGQVLGQVGAQRPPIVDPVVRNFYHCCADTGRHGIGGELAADSALALWDILQGRT